MLILLVILFVLFFLLDVFWDSGVLLVCCPAGFRFAELVGGCCFLVSVEGR